MSGAQPEIYEEPFGPADFQAAAGVSRETMARFEAWRALLVERNGVMNLVAASSLPAFWLRHAFDSFQLLAAAPAGAARWLDLGAGAGFPGLALALGLQDRGVAGARVTLVESIAKKAAFLEEAVAATGAPAQVLTMRAEALDRSAPYDVVTARALAPLPKLLGYAQPFVEKGAIALFPKGARHGEEIAESRQTWRFDVETIPSRTAPGAALLKIERIAHAR